MDHEPEGKKCSQMLDGRQALKSDMEPEGHSVCVVKSSYLSKVQPDTGSAQ